MKNKNSKRIIKDNSLIKDNKNNTIHQNIKSVKLNTISNIKPISLKISKNKNLKMTNSIETSNSSLSISKEENKFNISIDKDNNESGKNLIRFNINKIKNTSRNILNEIDIISKSTNKINNKISYNYNNERMNNKRYFAKKFETLGFDETEEKFIKKNIFNKVAFIYGNSTSFNKRNINNLENGLFYNNKNLINSYQSIMRMEDIRVYQESKFLKERFFNLSNKKEDKVMKKIKKENKMHTIIEDLLNKIQLNKVKKDILK
jgi:hypothetical protein